MSAQPDDEFDHPLERFLVGTEKKRDPLLFSCVNCGKIMRSGAKVTQLSSIIGLLTAHLEESCVNDAG